MFSSIITTNEQRVNILKNLAYISLKNWNIHIKDVQLIKYRENAVFKIIAEDSKQYALRIHRGGYHTDDELRSELEWMSALEEHDINVPIIVRTAQQQLFVKEIIDGLLEPLQIDLFEWIEGKLLSSAEHILDYQIQSVPNTYRTIGNIAARLHNQSTTWQLPDNFKRKQWDVEGLIGDQPIWGKFWELTLLTDSQREMILKARDIVRKEMVELSQKVKIKENFSLIHADLVPDNLMIVEDKVRLIDFDDAGFGWHAFELATVLYFIQNQPYYNVAKQALIDGYKEFRSLEDIVILKLPIFMMARGFTYLGWLMTRSDSKETEELAPKLIGFACSLAERLVNQHDVIDHVN